MNSNEFKAFANSSIQYITDYHDSLEHREVVSAVLPGSLIQHLPKEIPATGHPWQELLDDVDSLIMPGITHWQSPHFHAYYPEGTSYPCIVGEILATALGNVGINWISSPAATELEVIILDWIGKMVGLPKEFLNCHPGPGGGAIMNSASESTFIALIAAKKRAISHLQSIYPTLPSYEIERRLVAYSSDQANSSVEKASRLGSMLIRLLEVDLDGQLLRKTLQEAIDRDKTQGLIPCFVVANLGTTSTCSFDNLEELGPVCLEEKVWLHVDAAYAGPAFACPEYRYLMKGMKHVDSFVFNAHKWMLMNVGTSVTWYKDVNFAAKIFKTRADYSCDGAGLVAQNQDWSLSKEKQFKALKLWITLRIYGISGIQQHVRKHVELAQYLEHLIKQDLRFKVHFSNMGLVCFTLQDNNELSSKLVKRIQARKKIYLIATQFKKYHLIRFALCSRATEKRHIDYAWDEIKTQAEELLNTYQQ